MSMFKKFSDNRVLETTVEVDGEEVEVSVYCVYRNSQKPNPSSWDSDMDFYGYDEVEIEVGYAEEDHASDHLMSLLEDSQMEELTEKYKEEYPVLGKEDYRY